HAKASDAISLDQLNAKCQRIAGGGPLRITYVGRADEMKGPFDWLDVVELLKKQNISFHARWIGDGPLREEMRQRVSRRELDDVVTLPGFLADRQSIFNE